VFSGLPPGVGMHIIPWSKGDEASLLYDLFPQLTSSAKHKKKFRVFTGFHLFPSFWKLETEKLRNLADSALRMKLLCAVKPGFSLVSEVSIKYTPSQFPGNRTWVAECPGFLISAGFFGFLG
jgi:hypothetical protein